MPGWSLAAKRLDKAQFASEVSPYNLTLAADLQKNAVP